MVLDSSGKVFCLSPYPAPLCLGPCRCSCYVFIRAMHLWTGCLSLNFHVIARGLPFSILFLTLLFYSSHPSLTLRKEAAILCVPLFLAVLQNSLCTSDSLWVSMKHSHLFILTSSNPQDSSCTQEKHNTAF